MDLSSNRNSTVLTNNNGQDMRIITNPLNMNYVEPDDSLTTSFTNPNHIELPSRSPVPSNGNNDTNSNGKSIDSTTYCRSKRDGVTSARSRMSDVETDNAEIVGWNKPIPPPPLPPHALPLQTKKSCTTEDYRPPVPPHRNLASTSNTEPPVPPGMSTPKRNYYHQRSGSKVSEKLLQQAMESEANNLQDRELDDVNDKSQHVFEFDDEPEVKRETGDKMEFVQYPRSPSSKSNRNSAEVKRAAIVGNPMFSANENNEGKTASGPGETPADLPGLDDLQLDMDYDQIMHYFENLKESNA